MLTQVRDEIESLHDFFVGWFSGGCAEDADVFHSKVRERMEPEFALIQPSGAQFDRDGICEAISSGYGTNEDFRIVIRNLRLVAISAELVVATYEEWQRNAKNSKPVDNGRVSTVVFRRGKRLSWLLVHETWLPSDVMAAGPYDF